MNLVLLLGPARLIHSCRLLSSPSLGGHTLHHGVLHANVPKLWLPASRCTFSWCTLEVDDISLSLVAIGDRPCVSSVQEIFGHQVIEVFLVLHHLLAIEVVIVLRAIIIGLFIVVLEHVDVLFVDHLLFLADLLVVIIIVIVFVIVVFGHFVIFDLRVLLLGRQVLSLRNGIILLLLLLLHVDLGCPCRIEIYLEANIFNKILDEWLGLV